MSIFLNSGNVRSCCVRNFCRTLIELSLIVAASQTRYDFSLTTLALAIQLYMNVRSYKMSQQYIIFFSVENFVFYLFALWPFLYANCKLA